MKNLSLILRIVAIIAAVAATTLFFISKGKLAEKEELLTKAKNYITKTNAELKETSETLEKTEKQLALERESLASTREDLEETQSELFASQQDANKKKKLLGDALNQVSELEKTRRELRADLQTAREELIAADRTDEINQLNQEVANLEARNAELELDLESAKAVAKAVTDKKSRAGNLEDRDISYDSLNAGDPINRMRLETTIDSVSSADGLIVLKNNPELQLAEGQTLILVQDMNSAAKVRIQSITDEHAVANILPDKNTSAKKLSSGSVVELLL